MEWSSMTSKQQGLVGVGAAIAYFTKLGHVVLTPINDSQDYDLVVDFSGKLKKVQVKTTRYITPNNTYQVCLKSSGGTAGKLYGTVGESDCDLLFVLAEDGSSYLMPVEVVQPACKNLSLGKRVAEYKIH